MRNVLSKPLTNRQLNGNEAFAIAANYLIDAIEAASTLEAVRDRQNHPIEFAAALGLLTDGLAAGSASRAKEFHFEWFGCCHRNALRFSSKRLYSLAEAQRKLPEELDHGEL